MNNFFWPEYDCNTSSQVIVTEDDIRNTSSVTYLENYNPMHETEPVCTE